jgi:hypothetical protein
MTENNQPHAHDLGHFTSVFCRKLTSAIHELKQTKSSWLEIAFACMALAAGSWSMVQPYTSEWFEAPPWAVAFVFSGCGFFQLFAFIWRTSSVRQNAAVINGCMWAGVCYILFKDQVTGWMTSVAPVIVIFQAVVWTILEGHAKHKSDQEKGQ